MGAESGAARRANPAEFSGFASHYAARRKPFSDLHLLAHAWYDRNRRPKAKSKEVAMTKALRIPCRVRGSPIGFEPTSIPRESGSAGGQHAPVRRDVRGSW